VTRERIRQLQNIALSKLRRALSKNGSSRFSVELAQPMLKVVNEC
jgi:DNA-directed RNA polymerase sigma subunit (sigma70/sigma32)